MRSPTPINIVSPHHDDAALSLAITISRLTNMRYDVAIINIYTKSNYAPYEKTDQIQVVSALRVKEDSKFASSFAAVKRIDLGRLDAPLRLCTDQVRDGHAFTSGDHGEVEALCEALHAISLAGAFLLPLSLGNHIDHRIALKAGILAGGGAPIGFFEDLPYAHEYSDEEIQTVVDHLQGLLRCQFRPLVVRTLNFPRLKRRYLSTYPSQVGPSEIRAILSHARRYRGGERIWLDDRMYAELSCKL